MKITKKNEVKLSNGITLLKVTDIKDAYNLLKNRNINPSGKFDAAGRWNASNSDLICVRSPSRAYPYSEMVACRTLKYVKNVIEKFNCIDKSELLSKV